MSFSPITKFMFIIKFAKHSFNLVNRKTKRMVQRFSNRKNGPEPWKLDEKSDQRWSWEPNAFGFTYLRTNGQNCASPAWYRNNSPRYKTWQFSYQGRRPENVSFEYIQYMIYTVCIIYLTQILGLYFSAILACPSDMWKTISTLNMNVQKRWPLEHRSTNPRTCCKATQHHEEMMYSVSFTSPWN